MAEETKDVVLADNSLVQIDEQQLKDGLASINDTIDATLKLVSDLAISDADLASADYKIVKSYEQELSKHIKEVDKQRIAFKKMWEVPLNVVTEKVKDALDPAKTLHERYKAQRVSIDEREAEEKREQIENAYHDFLESSGLGSLADSIPFDGVFESKWLNKTCSVVKAINDLECKVAEIIADWQSLQKGQYHYPDDAQLVFFETLSLREVNERDAKRWEEQHKLEAINKEVADSMEFREEHPSIVAEAEQVLIDSEQDTDDPVGTYIIEVVMTRSQWNMLRAFFDGNNIHGSLKRVVANA